MKKRLISIAVVLVALTVAWTVYAAEGGAERPRRGGFGGMSAEERTAMRERFQNMSEEERQKYREDMRARFENMSEEERAQMRGRFSGRTRLSREDQLAAIKAVEEQLAKLKAGLAAQPQGRTNYRDLSEEERTKLREEFTKTREERNKAFKAIITQIARLQGQREPAEGEELIIINTAQLKSIQELAVKEKAKETAQRLERLMSRGRGSFFGGRSTGGRPPATGTTERPRRRSTQ